MSAPQRAGPPASWPAGWKKDVRGCPAYFLAFLGFLAAFLAFLAFLAFFAFLAFLTFFAFFFLGFLAAFFAFFFLGFGGPFLQERECTGVVTGAESGKGGSGGEEGGVKYRGAGAS